MRSNKNRKKINTKIKIKSDIYPSNYIFPSTNDIIKKSISINSVNKLIEASKKQLNNQKINNINNLQLKNIQTSKFIPNEPSTSSRTENNENQKQKIPEFTKLTSPNKKNLKTKNIKKNITSPLKKNKEELVINSNNNIISELRAYSKFRDKFNDLLEQESQKNETKTLLNKSEKKGIKNSVLKLNEKSRNNNETFENLETSKSQSISKTERIDTTASLNPNESNNENLMNSENKEKKTENNFSGLILTPMPIQKKNSKHVNKINYEKMLRDSKALRIYEYNMNLHKANMLKYEKFLIVIQKSVKKFLNKLRKIKEKKIIRLQKKIKIFLNKIKIRNKKIVLIQSLFRMHLGKKAFQKKKNIIKKFVKKLIFIGKYKNYKFFINRLKKTLSKRIKLTNFFNKIKKKIYNKKNFRFIKKKISNFIKLKESMKKLMNKIKIKNNKINSKYFLKNFKIFSNLKFRNKNIETDIPFEQPIKIKNIYKHIYLPISETFNKLFNIKTSNHLSKCCCMKMFPRPTCEQLTHSNILIKRIKKQYELENILETFKIIHVDCFLLNKNGFCEKKIFNDNNNKIEDFKCKKYSKNKKIYFNSIQLKNICSSNFSIKKNFNTHVKILRKKVILKKGSITKKIYLKNSYKKIKFLQKKIKMFLKKQKQKRIIKKNKEINLRLFLILLQKNYVKKIQRIIFDILHKDYLGSFYTTKSLIINSENSENDYEKIYEMENNFIHKGKNFRPEDGKINKVRCIKLTKNINGIYKNKFNLIDFNNEMNSFSKDMLQQKLFKK